VINGHRGSDLSLVTDFHNTSYNAVKLGLHINQGKTKCLIVERKNSSKWNKIGQLTITNYTSERVKNFKYLGIILRKVNNDQIDLQERIKMLTKYTECYKKKFLVKIYLRN
jgi:hypothetical protein